ncbi:MAG: hypothetical protein HOQ05_08230 [Corynebacteriales bacterium]|nr:hypothetical protein [Mycobacteriales bacterium]
MTQSHSERTALETTTAGVSRPRPLLPGPLRYRFFGLGQIGELHSGAMSLGARSSGEDARLQGLANTVADLVCGVGPTLPTATSSMDVSIPKGEIAGDRSTAIAEALREMPSPVTSLNMPDLAQTANRSTAAPPPVHRPGGNTPGFKRR